MKALGIVFLVLGALQASASESPEMPPESRIGFILGVFVVPVLVLLIGLKLFRKRK